MAVFVEQDDYAKLYYEAQKQARLFFLPFNEYERIASNKIREDLPPNMPKVNDGSLAALLLETPMRVMAQMPTGDVKVTESIDPQTGEPTNPQRWLQELANIIWTKNIIPHANTQAPFFNKLQVALYRALQYGACPVYSFYTSRGNYNGADFVIPYIRDVYLEPGKVSDYDSDFIFMDTYYTKLQIKNIIDNAKKVKKDGVDSPWNIPALEEVLKNSLTSEKDYRSKTQIERNKPVRTDQFKFTTIFQRGVEAPFETFHLPGEVGPVNVVRTKVNEDPTGDIPIHFLYAYEDLIAPYGKGQIELSGGTQNVLDYLVQSHVLGTQIGLQPPIKIAGNREQTDLDSLVYAPSQFWFTGSAQVEVQETASKIYQLFPQSYGMYKQQLLGMQGTSDVTISGESGDPITGKTPAAIAKTAVKESAHDNFLRQQVNAMYNKLAKSMLNIHFANMQGMDTIKVTEEDAIRLTRAGLIPAGPDGTPSTQEVEVDWEHLRGKFDFEVDPDSSIVKDDSEQVTKLQEILQLIQENPYLLQYITQSGVSLNLGEVYKAIFTKLGLQDVEKILTPLSTEEAQQAQATPPMAFDKPKIDLRYPDLPPAAQLQMLQRLGYTVSLEDVLSGPVLDPNIRGVEAPVVDPNVRLPSMDAQAQTNQQEGVSSVTQHPDASAQDGHVISHPDTSPQGPHPDSVALLQQVMAEHGVDEPTAMAIMHARAGGYPENEIAQYLKGGKKKGAVSGR